MRRMLALPILSGCTSIEPGTVALRVWVSGPTEAGRYEVIRGGRYWAHQRRVVPAPVARRELAPEG